MALLRDYLTTNHNGFIDGLVSTGVRTVKFPQSWKDENRDIEARKLTNYGCVKIAENDFVAASDVVILFSFSKDATKTEVKKIFPNLEPNEKGRGTVEKSWDWFLANNFRSGISDAIRLEFKALNLHKIFRAIDRDDPRIRFKKPI